MGRTSPTGARSTSNPPAGSRPTSTSPLSGLPPPAGVARNVVIGAYRNQGYEWDAPLGGVHFALDPHLHSHPRLAALAGQSFPVPPSG